MVYPVHQSRKEGIPCACRITGLYLEIGNHLFRAIFHDQAAILIQLDNDVFKQSDNTFAASSGVSVLVILSASF